MQNNRIQSYGPSEGKEFSCCVQWLELHGMRSAIRNQFSGQALTGVLHQTNVISLCKIDADFGLMHGILETYPSSG